MIVGKAAGAAQGNRHLCEQELTPNANALVAVAEVFGVAPDRISGNTGRIPL